MRKGIVWDWPFVVVMWGKLWVRKLHQWVCPVLEPWWWVEKYIEQRIIIKFLVCKNVKQTEFYRFGEAILSWIERSYGATNLSKAVHMLCTSGTNENIARVAELIKRNRWFTELKKCPINHQKAVGLQKGKRFLNDKQEATQFRIFQLLQTRFEGGELFA